MRRKKKHILVVNDDGVHGEGLKPLIDALSELGDVTTLVPEKERSAESHALTLHKPLRLRRIGPNFVRLNGGPADCARLGVLKLLKGKVDLIVSGINQGYNLGQDVVYSGTVAGAMEGALLDIPSFAISQGLKGRPGDYFKAALFARRLGAEVLRNGLPPGVILNVNVPVRPNPRGMQAHWTRLGRRLYTKTITKRRDPSGRSYYWLQGRSIRGVAEHGTDVAATQHGHIAVTPLSIDNTHVPSLTKLRGWKI